MTQENRILEEKTGWLSGWLIAILKSSEGAVRQQASDRTELMPISDSGEGTPSTLLQLQVPRG
ncbi:hypothetical protein yinte0001_25920 [Yersinia intermedia ATCC 29909]|nr:hypothetical protein yinte0001_25920 [Yersinia intermedia ATCC 29909]